MTLLLPCMADAAEGETQWIRIRNADVPTAVFLSFDYSAVLFRVTCDPDNRNLVIRYFGDHEVRLTPKDKIALGWGEDHWLTLQTSLDDNGLEARIRASSPALAPFLRDGGEKSIDAPNVMGEHWYVGQADELRAVAEACR
jgi:hypothetical protein